MYFRLNIGLMELLPFVVAKIILVLKLIALAIISFISMLIGVPFESAREYVVKHADEVIGGVTGASIVGYSAATTPAQQPSEWQLLFNILFGIVAGILVGRMFKWFDKQYDLIFGKKK